MDKYESNVKGTPLIYTPDGIQLSSRKVLFSQMTDIAFREGETPAWTFALKGHHMLVPYEEAEREFVEPFIRNAMTGTEADITTLLEDVPAAPGVEAPDVQRNAEPSVTPVPEKTKKPIYKRVWFIVLCIIVLIGIIGAIAGGGDDESADVNKNNATEAESMVEDNETGSTDLTADYSMEEKNCYQSALNYLDFMGFSKKGLIEQLSSEYGDNYPQETAEKVVNDLDEAGLVDWEKQAERSAQNYLDTMSFSKDELINQLCSDAGDQYTREEAEAAVEAVYK